MLAISILEKKSYVSHLIKLEVYRNLFFFLRSRYEKFRLLRLLLQIITKLWLLRVITPNLFPF